MPNQTGPNIHLFFPHFGRIQGFGRGISAAAMLTTSSMEEKAHNY